MLGIPGLEGRSFLDAGSGSGLFSLAAMRLGARAVRSFDYDPESVACTRDLKSRFQGDSSRWTVEQGSVLDSAFMETLGQWDIVYSWGVLHHTGRMIHAFHEVARRVAPGGLLFIAIYNDQGAASVRWRRVKRLFVSGRAGRFAVCTAFIPMFLAVGLFKDAARGRNPLRRFADYRKSRGMSLFHDWLDWLGGYPFEVARPEEVFAFFRDLGFELRRLKTCGGEHGCNEFVFVRPESSTAQTYS
jgi:2-polyprenyl-6-hydroxyphenyl methylase/3-demethylubiquinone-9 3-methyltransferase